MPRGAHAASGRAEEPRADFFTALPHNPLSPVSTNREQPQWPDWQEPYNLRPIPSPAYVPIAILFLGIDDEMKIFMIAFATFFPVLLNTYSGVRSVDPVQLQTARTFGVKGRKLLWQIVLTSASPYISGAMYTSTPTLGAFAPPLESRPGCPNCGVMGLPTSNGFGMSGPGIIFLELMPNLLPYLAATLVNSVSAAILASIGLEVLGLGPIDAPTLGMTLYWVNFNAAMINGWWWWWLAPTVVIVTVFLGLFFLTVGLDEIANPRLRRSA